MSSQTNTTINPPEQAVTVLLIAHKQNQFAAAASFLTRRGIPCTIKGNIKDGIQFIQKQKPTYIFLSWNLPHANIVKTYQLFTKNFKVDCIVFAEKSDGKTAAEIANSRLPQTMQAPVSGPGLYMRLQKLIKAKEEEKNVQSEDSKSQGHKDYSDKNDDNKIVFKGTKSNMDKDGYITFSSDKKNSDQAGIINFQNTKYSEEDIEGQTPNDDGNDISAYLSELEDDRGEGEGQENKNNPEIEISLKNEDSKELAAESKKQKETDYGSVVNAAKTMHTESVILDTANKTKEALLLNFAPHSESKVKNTILFEKTMQALNESTRIVYDNFEKVKKVSKAKILNIHSPRFRGYLIIVVPMFYELDRQIFSLLKEKIQTLLEKEGENLLHFEDLNIDLEQIDFLDWCQQYAEFFIQTADKKNEIICAYFPIEPSLPRIEESAKMAVIETKDLQAETKTNFSLFIHLPKNNKFLKYLKNGDTITNGHTLKFEQHSLKNLHIKKEELTSFKEYYASNQIKGIPDKKKVS